MSKVITISRRAVRFSFSLPARVSVLSIIFILIALVLAGLSGCSDAPPPGQSRPNIILITLDTTRVDHLSAYGYERDTSPQLDRLAADALRYDSAYAVTSWTLPSHASLFTGKFPSAHGSQMDLLGSLNLVQSGGIKGPEGWGQYRARPLSKLEVTLAQVLGQSGWATGAVVAGPWMKRVFGLDRGFEHYDDSNFVSLAAVGELNGRPAQDVSRAAIKYLDDHAHEPFFLFLNYYDPHEPYLPSLKGLMRYWKGGEVSDPPQPEFRVAQYDAEIRAMDRHLGYFLDHLRKLELYEDAWIIVTADHGELTGEFGVFGHGDSLSEPELRIPLIVKQPGKDRPRGVRSTLVQQVDVMPTLLRALDLPFPPNMQGGVLEDPAHPIVAEVYPIPPGDGSKKPWRQRGSWQVLIDGDFKLTLGGLGRHGLYDLRSDPKELNNLVWSEPERFEKMRDALTSYLESLPTPGEIGSATELDAETRELLRALGYVDD
jgi:arylsulfatase A-like enzyme